MESDFMRQALELAYRAKGKTGTNPCVGAVVVKDGVVVGTGWHTYYGGDHAEVVAISLAGNKAEGADLYVTLEPCSTYGKTPPCTSLIIEKKIKRVFIGALDPNPDHRGSGVKLLSLAGVEVKWGLELEACAEVIEDFSKYINTKMPFVTLKIAQSLDGKIATSSGDSKWITGEKSREQVHKMRMENSAVLIGSGTVLKDDPELTVRLDKYIKQPLRVVLDSECKISLDSKLVKGIDLAPLAVFTTNRAPEDKVNMLKDRGVDVISVGDYIDLKEVLLNLGKMNIMNLLVEGGSKVFGAFIRGGFVDELHFFIAPMIIGGDDSKSSVGGEGVLKVKDALKLKSYAIKTMGDDLWLKSVLSDYISPVIKLTKEFSKE